MDHSIESINLEYIIMNLSSSKIEKWLEDLYELARQHYYLFNLTIKCGKHSTIGNFFDYVNFKRLSVAALRQETNFNTNMCFSLQNIILNMKMFMNMEPCTV